MSVEGETLTIKGDTLSSWGRSATLTIPGGRGGAAAPNHDKGTIYLCFAPVDAPKEETILVKLEEQSTGIQHTVKINATWS